MSEQVEYNSCESYLPHGRHEVEPGKVCPGKDTGALPVLSEDPSATPEVHYGATAYLKPSDKRRPVEEVPLAGSTVTAYSETGEKLGAAVTNPDGYVNLDSLAQAAESGRIEVEVSGTVGHLSSSPFFEADPDKPHLGCGDSEMHEPHNWDGFERGESTTFFCRGIGKSWADESPEEPPAAGTPLDTSDSNGENRSLPVRWADRAMFAAEPIDASRGPEVHLLWMTPDPLGAIAAACKMYKGEVVRDLRQITDDERYEYLQQVMKTKLQAPFEFVKFHFLFEGVSRAFTHQHVRQRTAAYAQESLRFAVKEDMPQYLPPSIRENPAALRIWERSNESIQNDYDALISLGIPAEDARGRLPHDTLTRIHYTTDLRALLDHAGNRLCTQAQFEWRLVFTKLVETLRRVSTDNIIRANGIESVYHADLLASVFRPVCYATGKCEFMANFDRHCAIRERVQANHEAGRPSSEWETPGSFRGLPDIDPIQPGEWLLNHKSARKQ